MEKEIKVSIVVPVYNCEKYLCACIRSILGQTYENIELLLVDDGATDRSGILCDHYAANERVKVFHQKNQGVSHARNFGIAAASGSHIMFVDGDDTIEKNMVETLVSALRKEEADCAFCGLVHDYPDYSRNFPDLSIKKVTDALGAVREVLVNYIATAGPVCKLFHRNLLVTGDPAARDTVTQNNEGIFPVDLTIGEDAVAVVEALYKAEKVVFDTKPLYHYNHREESLMSASYSERDIDLIRAYERIRQRLRGQKLDKETRFRQIWAHFHVYDKMIRSGKYDTRREKEIISWLRRHILVILGNRYVGRKRKISMCMLLLNKKLYQGIICRRGQRPPGGKQ